MMEVKLAGNRGSLFAYLVKALGLFYQQRFKGVLNEA
jgi:hypothetical protein